MKYTIQFFANAHEILDFIATATSKTGLNVLLERDDGRVVLLDDPSAYMDGGRRYAFGNFTSPDLSAAFKDIDWLNRQIVLSVGNSGRLESSEGLHESSLSYSGIDERLDKQAGQMRRLLKSLTKTGIMIRNPNTGAEGLSKTLRFTEGAKAVSIQGMPLLPVAGHNRGRILS